MAITVTALDAGASTNDSASFTTAVVSPSANKLILLAVNQNILVETAGAQPNPPTLSGLSLTWELVWSLPYFGTGDHYFSALHLFRSMTSVAPTAAALNIVFDGPNDGTSWSLAEFDGVNTTGDNGEGAIVQIGYGGNTVVDQMTASCSLAAFTHVANGTYAAFGGADANARTWTPATGYSEIHDQAAAWSNITTIWRADNDTNPFATPSGTNAWDGVIAVELRDASAPDPVSTSLSRIAAASATATANASLTLIEPTGTQAGDLVLAWIAHRGTVTYKAPLGWRKVQEAVGGNTNTTAASGIGSAGLWYTIRGASAPSYVFAKNSGVADVGLGRTVTYRGARHSTPIRQSDIKTLGVATATATTSATFSMQVGDIAACFIAGGADTTFSGWQINGAPTALNEVWDELTTLGADTTNAMADVTVTSAIANQPMQVIAAATSRHVIAGVVLQPFSFSVSAAAASMIFGLCLLGVGG